MASIRKIWPHIIPAKLSKLGVVKKQNTVAIPGKQYLLCSTNENRDRREIIRLSLTPLCDKVVTIEIRFISIEDGR